MKIVNIKKHKLLAGIIIGIILVVAVGARWITSKKSKEISYQTETVSKGTLVSSISASGTISSSNYTEIETKASGTVKQVLVNNGDTVKKDQKIAELTLDEYGVERQAAAYLTYTDAVEAVKTSEKGKVDADISMWQARQSLLDAEEKYTDKNNGAINSQTHEAYTENERAIIDKTYEQTKLGLVAAEAKYKNAGAEIANARAKVTAAWRNYQDVSAVITAPADGVVTGLTLAPGFVIADTSTTSTVNGSATTTTTATTIGQINNPKGQLQAKVSLTQMDITKVAANQKVTLTLDAFTDKTFTGKVLAVDTSGTVNSNVTSYPVTILLDYTEVPIYPNMAVTAQIITNMKTDVLSVPATAIQTLNDQSMVSVMKDNKVSSVIGTLGMTGDSNIEIISGLNEGDVVVTGTSVASNNSSKDDASSDFSSSNRTNTNRNSSGSRSGGNVMMFGGPPGF